MNCPGKIFFVILFTFSFSLKAQVQVILDTDLDSDVDDVGAMAMLHTLADNRRIKILGVIVTSDDEDAAA